MTVDFASGYQPPGVYVEETTVPNPSTTSAIPGTVVALVGPSQGFQTNTESKPFSTTGSFLSKRGIDGSSVVVRRVDTGAVVPSSEYTLSADGNLADRSYRYVFSRTNVAGTTDGTPVFITYNFTDPSFYAAKTFTSFDDVRSTYGDALNPAQEVYGQAYQSVLSPITLAAQKVFENGASQVVCVPTLPPVGADASSPETRSSWLRTQINSGYMTLETAYAVNVVVPVTYGIVTGDAAGVGVDLLSHCNRMAVEGIYRIGIVGFDASVTTPPDTLLGTGGFRGKRLQLAYAAPGAMSLTGTNGASVSVGHGFLAAAYAGILTKLPIQHTLTRQQVAGFSGIAGMQLSNGTKDKYAQAGVALTEITRSNSIVIRHGITTDTANGINNKEQAVVRGRDAIVQMVHDGTESAGLIGTPVTGDTPAAIKSLVIGILEQAKAQQVIIDYSDLGVRLRSTDPSVIEIKFTYRPAYPLNYIVVSFSIDSTSGLVADDVALTA